MHEELITLRIQMMDEHDKHISVIGDDNTRPITSNWVVSIIPAMLHSMALLLQIIPEQLEKLLFVCFVAEEGIL